ncbi:lipopolysaccharide assembly protein LapA domain-containing protein [Neoroseomonas oryzicola]|uniref:LapA family protein n=1 Tax=Neoroseomonas oryzicola TaxID=535904 RepID=A0A9X9WEH0_9PROT|nr:LapA family protein [Neoroseomonas oryzicola]MBR0658730.1 LapA family protein [Neoroseomonas oryzicola]NKE17834.1 LapA family protein [Neoroseomonas oryzicola]
MRLLLFIPLAALVVLFALSNRQPVELRLWPFDVTWTAPVSLAVLLPAAVAFLLGALIVWLADLPARRRGWSAQRRATALQSEIDRIHAAEKAAAADRLAGPA